MQGPGHGTWRNSSSARRIAWGLARTRLLHAPRLEHRPTQRRQTRLFLQPRYTGSTSPRVLRPAAFGRRCIRPACVVARSNAAGLSPRTLRAVASPDYPRPHVVGMGVVYTAHYPRLKRQVAIKLLTADLTRDETAKQRFLQEAQAASALDHPNIRNPPQPEELEQESVRRSKNDETDSATRRSSDSAQEFPPLGHRRSDTRASRADRPGLSPNTRPAPGQGQHAEPRELRMR